MLYYDRIDVPEGTSLIETVMIWQTKWTYFLIEDDDLLERYNTIWDKVSADIKKEFDSELVYNKNYLKAIIKSHGDEVDRFLR